MVRIRNKNGEVSAQELFKQKFGKPIEDFDTIKRATETLKEETKNNYKWQLAPFFLFIEENPDTVINNRKKDLVSNNLENEERYERKVKKYKTFLLEKGYTGRSVGGILGRIQGFFTNNSKRLALDLGHIRLPKARKHRKFSPENEQVKTLFTRADCSRDKFIVAAMYQNGFTEVDVSCLGVNDYPLEPWQYFERSRSKTGEVIRGVSMPDACEALKSLLNIKDNVEGTLLTGREGLLDNRGVGQVVTRLISSVPDFVDIEGFKPTSLRDAFEDAMVDAGVKTKIKEGLMGRTADIEHEYGGYKQMVQHFVEAARQVYPYVSLSNRELFKDSEKVIEELKADNTSQRQELEAMRNAYDEKFARIEELVKSALSSIEKPNGT